MRIIKSLKFRIGKLNPIKYARSLGVQIGDDCKFIGMPNFGSEPYLIRLGNHVEISNDVQFITHDGGTWVLKGLENGSTVLTFRKIVIEDNCFIGAKSIIMGGCNIGKNVVIGAGSIVTKDIPDNSVVCGIPARVVKSIDEYRDKLIKNEPSYDKNNYREKRKSEILRMCDYE